MTGNWTVELEDGMHSVAAEISEWTGKLTISWDGHPIDISHLLIHSIGSNIRSFERNGHKFVLSISLVLSMDGVDVCRGGALTAQRKVPLPSLQFVQEQNVIETEEIVSVEDYPLDNTFGTDELASERHVSKESTNELALEATNQLSGTLGLELFSALHAEVAAQLSKKTGTKVGEKMTESQTLRFTVGAGKSVVYQVVWKRKVRTGEHLYLTDGSPLTVPYRMNYGLSLEVRTIERRYDAR